MLSANCSVIKVYHYSVSYHCTTLLLYKHSGIGCLAAVSTRIFDFSSLDLLHSILESQADKMPGSCSIVDSSTCFQSDEMFTRNQNKVNEAPAIPIKYK